MIINKIVDFFKIIIIRRKLYLIIKKKFHFINNNNNIKKDIILIEFNKWSIFHISSLYLLNSLQKTYKCKTIAFYNNCYLDRYIEINLFKTINIFFSKIFKFNTFGIYNSLGCEDLIYPKLSSENFIKTSNLYYATIKKIKKKEDILKIKIDNIKIGDLLYDSYLKRYKQITIDIKSDNFKTYLKLFIYLFLYWKNFFLKNNIKSIISSHSVYSCGIPVRIAISKKIKVFIPNTNYLYQLNKNQKTTDIEFFDYKSNFNKFTLTEKKKFRNIGKKKLEKRFKGNFDHGIYYSKNTSYKKKLSKFKIIKKNKNFNILIAAHSFSDAPHVYGENMFVDFREWLNFLGELSQKTKFDWYIKDGPDYPSSNKIFIKEFLNKFPNIIEIPSDTSHHLLRKNINLVLTCYGTIAHEYPYFKIPVINASSNNPHINYDFCYHPLNKKNYKELILNSKKLKVKASKEDIFEFVYMRYVNKKFGYVIDLQKFLNKNSFTDLFNKRLYSFFFENYSNKKSNLLIKKMNDFVKSEDYIC